MGNKSKNQSSTSTEFSAELTPEGLRKLREKMVKPTEPKNQEELDKLIDETNRKISSVEDKIERITETLAEGSNDTSNYNTLLYSLDDFQMELEDYQKRLEDLENTHFF